MRVRKTQWNYERGAESLRVIEINNYSSWLCSNCTIKDSSFKLCGFELQIAVRPEASRHMPYDDPLLIINLLLRSNNSVDVELEVSVINSEGINLQTDTRRVLTKTGIVMGLNLNTTKCMIPNNRVMLHCKVGMFELVQLNDQEADFKVPVSTLADNLGALLDSGKAADIILSCKGEQFKAHKSILAARSPVFAAMFRHDFKEQKLCIVDIVDMEPDVLREMLKYMYTDKTSDLEMIANGLLAAADKYALERLRIICERSLAARLSIESAADTLIIADTHSADQLKKKTILFIKTHKAAVIKTAGWKRMLEERVHLILETFELIEN